MLLYNYGFVSRTRFIFAALRTAVVTAGLVVAIVAYGRPDELVLDIFLYTAAVAGMLVALRLQEQARRRVFFQELVIRGQAAELEREKDQSDRLLLNILPASSWPACDTANSGSPTSTPLCRCCSQTSSGSRRSRQLSPAEVIDLLGGLFTDFDALVAERGLEKIKTIGDAYMAAAGCPSRCPITPRAASISAWNDRDRGATRPRRADLGSPGRDQLGARDGRGHRNPQVRVRHLGRHGERCQQARVPGSPELGPRQPGDPRSRPAGRPSTTAPSARWASVATAPWKRSRSSAEVPPSGHTFAPPPPR